MDHEQNLKTLKKLFDNDIFLVAKCDSVNFNPHPYTIGTKHVVFASDHHSGLLGDTALDAFEKQGGKCAHPNCYLKRAEHTHDNVVFLQLKRNANQEEVRTEMKKMLLPVEKMGYQGFGFFETPEKFRMDEKK